MKKVAAVLLLAAFLTGCAPAWAACDWNVENVYKAIVAEAVGEGVYRGSDGRLHLSEEMSKEGMTYVASCFWNRRVRGMDLGSCGLLRRSDLESFISRQPTGLCAFAHQLADRVMLDVEPFDLVHGATQFESTDFKTPSWVLDGSYREVFRYRKHIFYRKVKK